MLYSAPKTSLALIMFLSYALLQGCGVPGPGGGSNDSGSGSTFVTETTIGIIVEATDGMQEAIASNSTHNWQNDWQNELFAMLSPTKALALEGLSELNGLNENQITVVALDENFEENSNPSVPNYKVVKRLSNGYEIRFAATYTAQINLAVKVTFSTDNFIYAPLYNTSNDNESIRVNVGSHYVLKKLFDAISTPENLSNALFCTSNISDCPNQSLRKADLLKLATITADGFDIEIDKEQSTQQALTFLDSNIDFRTHVEAAVTEITRELSPIAKGISRTFNILDGEVLSKLNVSNIYNSSMFTYALNNYRPDNNQDEVTLSTANSYIVDGGELEFNNLPIYPNLFQSSSLLEIRRDTITTDIPFDRKTLLIDEQNSVSEQSSEPINTFSSAPSDTFLSTEGSILNERQIEQTIPGIGSDPKDIGWNINPLYTKLYLSNDSEPSLNLDGTVVNDIVDYGNDPTWLTGANYGGGAIYQLSENSDGVFSREDLNEDLNLFSWEIHGLRTDTSFSSDDISGKNFGVIRYSIDLNNTSPIIKIFADTLKWEAGSTEMTERQDDPHYNSYTLSRNTDRTVVTDGPTSMPGSNTRRYGTKETEEATPEHPTGVKENRGLIGLDGGSRAPVGHSTQNGKHLAFVQDTVAHGRGLMIATETRSDKPEFPVSAGDRDIYVLQGNTIEMTDSFSQVRNLNGSTLKIIGDIDIDTCTAHLTVNHTTLIHNIDSNTLSTSTGTTEQLTSSGCILNASSNGEIEIQFANVYALNDTLILKGFVTETGNDDSATPGNLINLLWIQDNTLGLIFAQKDQQLSPTFDE